MSTQFQVQTVPFHGHSLTTIKQNQTEFVAMRPVVEGIGLAWGTQQQKLERQHQKFNCIHMNTVAEDGKRREMLCIPFRKLNGWLFSINPEKVKPEIKERVILYQEECFEVLYRHFHPETNPPSLTPAQQLAIRTVVACRVFEQASRDRESSFYGRIYAAMRREFEVNRFRDVPDVGFEAVLKFASNFEFEERKPMPLPEQPIPPQIEPAKPTYPTKKMTVHGNAMLGDGIKDGDTVTVRLFEDISPDAIFVVKTPFGPIARRVKNLHGEEVILNASNPQVKDQLWLVKDITLVGVILGKDA